MNVIEWPAFDSEILYQVVRNEELREVDIDLDFVFNNQDDKNL